MEFSFYDVSSIWRDARKRRIATFVRILSFFMIAAALQWMVLTIIEHIYVLTFATIGTVGLGIGALRLVRLKKILSAKIIILIAGVSYFLTATIFAAGYGINNGTAHFGFITLGLVSYFLFYEYRIYREVIAMVMFALFFLFHYGYAPFYPLVDLPPDKEAMVNMLSVVMNLLIMFFVTRQFVIEITKSEEALVSAADKLEGLIGSMLPTQIVERMRIEGRTFADEFTECSVLFADIEGFTSWTEKLPPNEVVNQLNSIFSQFDDEISKVGLTKIKTNGDSYMVASGIPEFRKDHALVLVNVGLTLQRIAHDHSHFRFRIGINSGAAVAGIIGKKIFMYDLWGDTVNTASRMESSGEAGKVNISESTYALVKDKFTCTHRGKIQVKNKGEIDMYFVEA